ncbi:alcohol dehydrogenase-like 4 [Olea europaea subsp. europaea]|uniref:Alcohol dehydrogenase-like 4 n=1 Tax=Olea europaea subsp. europaea TaxID=158383 RepID=A0A8S0PMK2_OLEEU|nr:alcohol dehydrogenase-like 4 [Olea europaea subsp. europaea]
MLLPGDRVVESVGGGVTDLKAGDHVIPIFNGECGHCVYCKSENTNLCDKFRVNPFKCVMLNDGKCRFSTKDGNPIFHFLNTSTFSEYTVLDSACVVKIDPKAPLNRMVLLSCCFSTGVGAVWNTAKVKPGSSVAVFGLGAVGLAVVEGARAMGASKIIGVDVNPAKLAKGQKIGLTDFINPKLLDKPVHEEVKDIAKGGVDYSFECAGNLDVLREAFLSSHDGWGLTVVLGVHPSPSLLPLHPMELFDGRKIVASTFGDFKGKSQLPDFAKQCMDGVVEGARAMGASKIIGVDVNPAKLAKGQKIGLTDFINPKLLDKPVHEKVKDIAKGGVDYSFECAGNLDVLREAFLSSHDGWGLTVVLGVHPSPSLLPLHPMELFDGRKIVASTFGDFKGKSQLPDFAKQCMDGVGKLDEFISHELPFEKINDAFQLLIEGKSLRCLLHL